MMRRYQSHKIVEAALIVDIGEPKHPGESYPVATDDGETMDVPASVFARGRASIGDYMVRYAPDGYLSWSPAKAFEDGYTLIEEAA
jgi:hypothetical protein